MRAFVTPLALCVAITEHAAAQSPSHSLCIFSGRERSALAWQSAARSFNDGGLRGHILRLRGLQPVQAASVTLEPGGLWATSDSAGRFQITGAPNGRYLLRVRAIGHTALSDSITLGADGLLVLAVLSEPAGDIGITCPTSPVPPRRPPNEAQDKLVPVTVRNFQRAESDRYFDNAVKQGAFGKLAHYRILAPIERQAVVRMNRDTFYSSGVFDLAAGPVTVTLPDAGTRLMSLQAVTEDHYSPATRYAPARVTLTRAQVGTRYVLLIVRTLVNPNDAADVQAVHSLQDQIRIDQPGGPGQWETPNWDPVTQAQVRDHLASLQALGGCDGQVLMGTREAVDPVCHLIATATGWGLSPQEDVVYNVVYPATNDAKTVHTLTVRDVPVDGFWSISVYNEKGYFEKNDLDSYSINNLTAKPGADGSYTIQFGGCTKETSNCLVTPVGWNYMVRQFRPRKSILDGTWKFPEAQPVR